MTRLDLVMTSVRGVMARNPVAVCICILVLCAVLMPQLVLFCVVFCSVYYAITKLMVIAVRRGVL